LAVYWLHVAHSAKKSDPHACERQSLRFVIDQTNGAVHATALRLWEEFQQDT
jgi:hypothetical protein